MAKYRMVRVDFWLNPIISEEMSPEDKYFYLYLLTSPHTTQIGIYKITKKQMAFDLGYSIKTVHALMERFSTHHKLIQYNPETRELAIKNWGKDNLHKGGKPVMDCIFSELKEVEDTSLISYVLESIPRQEIRSLYESFCDQEESSSDYEGCERAEQDTYHDLDDDAHDDTFLPCYTIRGQKEEEKEKEKQLQKEKSLSPNIVKNPYIQIPLELSPSDVREIIEFWDYNGFGLTNVNAKQQLLAWLDESSFLQPKDVIVKAMEIACANNKRKLNTVRKTPTIAFTVEGYSPQEVCQKLCDEYGIFIADGHFYASTLEEKLGVDQTDGWVRAGLAPYNTEEEGDRFLRAIKEL